MGYGSLSSDVAHTVVLIKLPLLPEPCRLLDSACRKLASLVLASDALVLVLPPPSLLSRFWNELSSDDVLSLLLVLLVSVLSVLVSLLKLELADSLVIRLCRSDSSLAGPPPKPPPCPCDGSPYCVDELLGVPLLLCECSAPNRLCKKLPSACWVESVLSVLVSVLLVDALVLPLVLLPLLSELEPSVTPIAESALAIALAKPPPPPPGGGGGGPSGISLVPVPLLELPL